MDKFTYNWSKYRIFQEKDILSKYLKSEIIFTKFQKLEVLEAQLYD